jgi:hypothetical protein
MWGIPVCTSVSDWVCDSRVRKITGWRRGYAARKTTRRDETMSSALDTFFDSLDLQCEDAAVVS